MVRGVMLPLLMGRGRRPRWWRGRSARRLGVVAAWGFAVAAALVVSLCFVGGALASGKLSYLLCSLSSAKIAIALFIYLFFLHNMSWEEEKCSSFLCVRGGSTEILDFLLHFLGSLLASFLSRTDCTTTYRFSLLITSEKIQ